MHYGKRNIAAGLFVLAGFMALGFFLIYMAHLSPSSEKWAAEYAAGAHLETRMAHVHGNLFALLNIVFGLLLLKLPFPETTRKWVSWLALAGLLMPIGIFLKVALGLPPVLVVVGALSILVASLWLGIATMKLRSPA